MTLPKKGISRHSEGDSYLITKYDNGKRISTLDGDVGYFGDNYKIYTDQFSVTFSESISTFVETPLNKNRIIQQLGQHAIK